MNDIEKRILEDYARDYNVESESYQMLGIMLDENFVEHRLRMFSINHMYIYGGTYFGQVDHVRLFGYDYKEYIEKYGLDDILLICI